MALQRIARGLTYRQILDLSNPRKAQNVLDTLVSKGIITTTRAEKLKHGAVPLSVQEFNDKVRNGPEFCPNYLPCATDLHGSLAPQGVPFGRVSNLHYGEGYHVSVDRKSGEKIIVPLPKELPGADGNSIDIPKVKNHIVLAKIGLIDGKASIEYEHDEGKNETLLHFNTGRICIPFALSEEDLGVKSKDGILVASQEDGEETLNVVKNDNMNWNGILTIFCTYGWHFGWFLDVSHNPSKPIGMMGHPINPLAEPPRN